MTNSTTIYICQLPKAKQSDLKKDILSFYAKEGINPNEKDSFGFSNINNAMGGRLTDLEENIDIQKYL